MRKYEVPIHVVVYTETQEEAYDMVREIAYFSLPGSFDPIVTEPVDITEEN
jgi:hypothetical protein